jgi:hypothetical protein
MHSAARVACATCVGLPIAGNRPVKAVARRVLEKSNEEADGQCDQRCLFGVASIACVAFGFPLY